MSTKRNLAPSTTISEAMEKPSTKGKFLKPNSLPQPNLLPSMIHEASSGDGTSTGKFLKPSSSALRAKSGSSLRLNSTFGSTRSLNQPLLDSTVVETGGPNKDNLEVKHILAYNNYLQSLIKRQLIKKTSTECVKLINNQTLVRMEKLYKTRKTCTDIRCEIEEMKENAAMSDQVGELTINVGDMTMLFSKYNILANVNMLFDILSKESNLLCLKNGFKPIESQEEYDELLKEFTNLSKYLEHVVNTYDLDKVAELAKCLRICMQLDNKVVITAQDIIERKKEMFSRLLISFSDMFAKTRGL